MKKDAFLSLLRHALTYLGGIATTHGVITDSTVQELIGPILTIAGIAWGVIDEQIAAKKLEKQPLAVQQALK